jgi:hypothetical protein
MISGGVPAFLERVDVPGLPGPLYRLEVEQSTYWREGC